MGQKNPNISWIWGESTYIETKLTFFFIFVSKTNNIFIYTYSLSLLIFEIQNVTDRLINQV